MDIIETICHIMNTRFCRKTNCIGFTPFFGLAWTQTFNSDIRDFTQIFTQIPRKISAAEASGSSGSSLAGLKRASKQNKYLGRYGHKFRLKVRKTSALGKYFYPMFTSWQYF